MEIKFIKGNKVALGAFRKTVRKLRVAAYCRVSTDSEDQIKSYNSMIKYYTDLIEKNDEWEFVGIYADKAITGTNVKKRNDFKRLIEDCTNGEIDMIITKSIPRFARNTLDTLKYVRMLKEMQKTVYNSVMFEKAGPQQKWIIENLLGSAIAELDEYPYAIGLKNKNLIESKVVHPESEYDYVDRFDDDETDYLDYDCRYSLFEPNTKESKNISAKQECMKEGIVKKIPFLLTKEMIAVCINHSNTTYAKFIYEKTDDGKTKVILYPGNVSFVVEIESLSMSSDIRKAKIIFSSLKAQYKDMNEELFNEIQERIIERYIRLMAWEEIEKISTLNFHVRMRECDLLKLYQYYIFDRSRQRLIVNAKPYDNDQLYVNILGNRINLNDILIGDHYKWNPEKFPKIYDGSFKDFLESFDFEANGICRVHDSIYASDENDILIGRKMKSVIDKLF